MKREGWGEEGCAKKNKKGRCQDVGFFFFVSFFFFLFFALARSLLHALAASLSLFLPPLSVCVSQGTIKLIPAAHKLGESAKLHSLFAGRRSGKGGEGENK